MDMSPAGLGTKNDCAGEGQQQFNRPTDNRLVLDMRRSPAREGGRGGIYAIVGRHNQETTGDSTTA
jgi:hypothetical protein